MVASFAQDEYAESGYGYKNVGYGKSPAILGIDFQKAHTLSEFPYGGKPLVVRALKNTRKLLKLARTKNIPVALCYTGYQKEQDMPYWKLKPVCEQYFEGNRIIELDDDIADKNYDFIVRKTGPSMFYETKVDPFLVKAGVDTIIITGVNTSGCVRATVIDSFQRGYRTIVPEPCVGDIEEAPHRSNLLDVGRRYADVVEDIESVIDYISGL